jgi:hypothetical protein
MPRNFHCAVTAQGELQRVKIPPGTPNITTSHTDRGPPRICRDAPPLRNIIVQNSERLHGKECWLHPQVRSLSRVGLRATVGILKTGYPRVQSFKSRRKIRRVCMPACLVTLASSSYLLPQDSSRATTCLMAPAPTIRSRGSSGTATCPLGSSSGLLAQGSSGAVLCPMGRLYRL